MVGDDLQVVAANRQVCPTISEITFGNLYRCFRARRCRKQSSGGRLACRRAGASRPAETIARPQPRPETLVSAGTQAGETPALLYSSRPTIPFLAHDFFD